MNVPNAAFLKHLVTCFKLRVPYSHSAGKTQPSEQSANAACYHFVKPAVIPTQKDPIISGSYRKQVPLCFQKTQ